MAKAVKLVTVTVIAFLVQDTWANRNHAPRFQQEIEIVTTVEEEPIGTDLLRVHATDANGDKLLYEISGDKGGYFVINRETGEIKIAKIIDKEKLSSKTIDFQVIAYEAQSPGQRAIQQISVHVRDINDNAPVFSKREYFVNISENAKPDSFIEHMRATDADESSELLFYIISGNEEGHFKINAYTGVIKLVSRLDYEAENQYVITVAAEDNRPTEPRKHRAEAKLFVRVIDEDDNGAIFAKSNYSCQVIEGTHKNEIIAQVIAYDLDRGIRSPVRYSIDPATNTKSIFAVDSKGYVSISGTVDRETQDLYIVTLLAQEVTDLQVPKHPPARTRLFVRISDINDNPPVFSSLMYYAEVTENKPIGTIILKVTATDADEDENAVFSYKLRNQGQEFGINQRGEVFITNSLDKEVKDNYKFQVIAVEEGHPDQTADVTVIVLDDNDHSPHFYRSSYYAEVFENEEPGKVIVTVSASDKDYGENAKIQYSIIPDADRQSDCFRVGFYSGELVANCSFDREKKEDLTLLVKASDSAPMDKRRADQTVVHIKIKDRNDEKPKFESTSFVKTVEYDVEVPWHIVTVKAIDKDSGKFGEVQYRFIHGNDQGIFNLDSTTGKIDVTESLVRMSGQHFDLGVEAFDNDGVEPSNISPEHVSVKVTVQQGRNSVVLAMKSRLGDVMAEQDLLISRLKQLLRIGVMVDRIEKGEGTELTKLVFHGYSESDFKVVDKEVIIKNLDKLRTSDSFFRRFNVTSWFAEQSRTAAVSDENKLKADKWHPIIYAVLGFSALIAILGMAGIIYLIRSKRRGYDDSHESQASARMIPTPNGKPLPNGAYWMSDDGFESVSQGVPESFMDRSSYLDRSFERFEPGSLSSAELLPFPESTHSYGVPEFRPPSRCSNASSRASSVFAASSVMTVFKAPDHRRPLGRTEPIGNVLINPLPRSLPRRPKSRTYNNDRDRERMLPVIVDIDGKSKTMIDCIDDPFDCHDSGHYSSESQNSSC